MSPAAREKRLWGWVMGVVAAIFGSLFIGRPLASQLRDQNVQAVFFLTGLVLTAVAVLVYGWKRRPHKRELAVWLGIAAVYVMLIFRLGAPERSHLIEYSVLAILIHAALAERKLLGKPTPAPALLAWAATGLIGIVDEGLQRWLPNRTFDYEDIVFNVLAASLAIGTVELLRYVRGGRSQSVDPPP